MLYNITRPLATIAIRTTFRKIYFTNEGRIPWGKPIILAINHPTSFIEPCLLATHLPEPLYFLARGDLFKKSWHATLLNSVHILPIFRMKDGGYSQIKNNFSTLEKCFDAIRDQKTILIMAEGNCVQEKRLRPLRKGTGRLAFGAIEQFPDLDIQIVPVGVNYTYPNDFRSEIMLDFGQPIAVQDYMTLYQSHPQEAIRDLTEELDIRLRKRIVIIDHKEDEALTEVLLQLYRNDHPDKVLPIVDRKKTDRLKAEINIARSVNNLPLTHKTTLNKEVLAYTENLTKYNQDDWALANPKFPVGRGALILGLGFLPFLLGYVGNYLPVKFAQWYKNHRVKDIEDKMSVGIAIGIGSVLLYYLILAVTGSFLVATKWLWLILLLPIWGYFSLVYRDYFLKWKASFQWQRLPNATRLSLAEQRRNIHQMFNPGTADHRRQKPQGGGKSI